MSESLYIYSIVDESDSYERLSVWFAGEEIAHVFTAYGYDKHNDINSLDLVEKFKIVAEHAQMAESVYVEYMTEKEYEEERGEEGDG